MTPGLALPVAAALAVAAGTPALAADPADGPAIFGLVGMELAFLEALIVIAQACICVPLSLALGLGTVIGYLAAGIVAGIGLPVSFAREPGELLYFAEFGVVLFLFVIGLEFRPARLWEMRGTIFGRGLSQVTACAALLSIAALLTGLDWRAALIISLGLALSSTALVMRGIDESGERNSLFGHPTSRCCCSRIWPSCHSCCWSRFWRRRARMRRFRITSGPLSSVSGPSPF